MNRTDIPGNEPLKDTFVRMVDRQRVPHAILIHGVEGGAGLPLALFLTQYLMCESPEGGDVCGRCSSCQKCESYTHPDVHFIAPVNTNGKEIKRTDDVFTESVIASWRQTISESPYVSIQDWYKAIGIENKQGLIGVNEGKELQKKLALKSYEGRHKVFLIWHADRMNTTFANKMLKNLEEPNRLNTFILVSEFPGKLISTIASRVQKFQEELTTFERMVSFVQDKFDVDHQTANAAVFRGEGRIQHIVQELSNQGDSWLELFKPWMRMAWKRDITGLYSWSEDMSKRNRDEQKQFVVAALKMLDRCFRMAWIEQATPFQGEEAKFYEDFSPYINAVNVQGFLETLEETGFHIERNVNAKIVWYDTSILAIRLIHEGKKLVAST